MTSVIAYQTVRIAPTVALWVPKGVDMQPAMVETLAFADWVDGKHVLIRGLGVKEQWVPADEVKPLKGSPKVKVVSWLELVAMGMRN